MVKYCMNLQTGSIREQDNLPITPRRSPNIPRLTDTRNGFKPVPVPADLPVELRSNRGRIRNRNKFRL